MTEQEWLECEDPQRMLSYICDGTEAWRHQHHVSDRKLRLFACACWRAYSAHWLTHKPTAGIDHGSLLDAVSAAEKFADNLVGRLVMSVWPLDGSGDVCAEETIRRIGGSSTAKRVMANLLRDIIGNPFRPIYWADDPKRHAEPYTGPSRRPNPQDVPHVEMRRSWLTPTVITLAEAAYEEREMVSCKACVGGKVAVDTGAKRGPYRTAEPKYIIEPPKLIMMDCDKCHGTGCITTGHLDPVRLAVLADALEEAGASEMYAIEKRTIGNTCPDCDDFGFWRAGQEFDHMKKCRNSECGMVWVPGEAQIVKVAHPNPLLAHLRSPGPHYRGCWAVDLLTGKE